LAGAAGLGQLNVVSSLGQALHAEIDILSVRKEDVGSLLVRLGSPEAYRQANLEYGAALGGISLRVLQRPNGQPYIRVASSQPVNEPFVNLLVELNWPSGKLVREYSALLDPPGYASAPQAAVPVAAAPVAPVETRPAPAMQPPAAVAAPAPATTAGAEYGPVKRGETLSKIATGVKPAGVSLEQMLVGILIANPEAFINNNINLLKAGAKLRIPDQAQLTAMPQDKARQDVRVQTADWNRYRRRLADSAGTTKEPTAGSGKRAAVRIKDSEDKSNKDVLRLSSGQTAGGKARSSTERIQNLEEELIARDRALNEANARIKELEKAVKDTGAKK
jgi:pilus assembly protein FimV